MFDIDRLIKLAQKMGAEIRYNDSEGGLFYIENGVKKSYSFDEEYKELIKSQNDINSIDL